MERYIFALTIFVAVYTIQGRKTVHMAHRGLLGVESNIDKMGERWLFVQKAMDGTDLVKLWYSHTNTGITCDLLKDVPQEMLHFLNHFLFRHAVHQSDFEQMKLLLHLGAKRNFTWSMVDSDRMEGKLENARLIDLKALMSKCREFDKVEAVKATAIATTAGHAGDVQYRTRHKRGFFICPGTKWCGSGNNSGNYWDLGKYRETDKCCRAHDFCPDTIGGRQKKYNYFNWRATSLSHCDCDERFRACLKINNDSVSNLLGFLYFDLFDLDCFTLKHQPVCVKRSFWGRCEQYQFMDVVQIMGHLHYYVDIPQLYSIQPLHWTSYYHLLGRV